MINLLKLGSNTKLGKGIASFNLPPVITCPGRTIECEKVCYANSHRFQYPNVKKSCCHNYLMSQDTTMFYNTISTQLHNSKSVVAVRLHASGDFYSTEYIKSWTSIVKDSPTKKFWGYTRSWRIQDPDMQAALKALSELPNMSLYASTDSCTKEANEVPPTWLKSAELVNAWENKSPRSLKCLNQLNDTTKCTDCKICFTHKDHDICFKKH